MMTSMNEILSPLLTDLYQLTMAQGYWQTGRANTRAVFHLSCRRHPFQGQFTVAAGLASLIEYITNWRFDSTALDYLATLKSASGRVLFAEPFLRYLEQLTFNCDMVAMPEGALVFPNQPLVRIVGPILQAQLLETALLTLTNIATLVATKAARVRLAAGEDLVAEFGLRRAQGPAGGLYASRAAYLGGVNSTSNVLAGELYCIPVSGTLAHSWIMSYSDELSAFKAAADLMGNDCVLLVDTYHTATGVKHAIEIAKYLQQQGKQLYAIRLDSGDLPVLAVQSRTQLDAAGFPQVKIIASGDLDEYRIAEFKQRGAPIDMWGVGTRLVTAYDQPALDLTYKLAAIQDEQGEWSYKMKLTDDRQKTSLPGMLQVRRYRQQQQWIKDVVYSETLGVPSELADQMSDYEDLLVPIYQAGQLVYAVPNIADSRAFCMAQYQQFAKQFAAQQKIYPVELEPALSSKIHKISQ